jgi:hypothetical protein
MKTTKKSQAGRVALIVAGQFAKAMEKSVNDNEIGVQTVDSGRKNKVEPQSTDQAIPGTAEGIQKKPSQKLQKMGARHGRNPVPDDYAEVLRAGNIRWSKREALDALGVEMNFAMLMAREALEEFGKGALRAMAAVHEG